MTRLAQLVLALAGLVLALALALARRDRRGGPPWGRRLAATALGLLAGLGCADRGNAAGGRKDPVDPQQPRTGLDARPERQRLQALAADGDALAARDASDAGLEGSERWRRVRTTWREAEEVASGRRGAYPFDTRGKEDLLAALERAMEDTARLADERLLSAPEAALATEELAALVAGVRAKRPTEMVRATCYKPAMFTPAQASLERLRARLPSLEKLAAGGALHAAVVRKVVAAARADLAAVEAARGEASAGAPGGRNDDPGTAARAVEAALSRIEARLPPEAAP